jgi:DNA-binding CsgD family transcriptional regulator
VSAAGKMRALTPPERRYLLDMARGLSAYEVAERNHVSVHTVRSAMKTAKPALHARSIGHAIALAMAFGEFTAADVKDTTDLEGKYRV